MPVTTTYPGVYIEEIPSGVRTITGVSTSIAAFAGWAAKGPTDRAQRILSWPDFDRYFGGMDVRSLLGYSVYHFFANGGTQAYIVRLVAGDAVSASASLDSVLDVTAKNEGEWANSYSISIKASTFDPSRFQLVVVNGNGTKVETFENLSMDAGDKRYVETVINNESVLINAEDVAGDTTLPADTPTPVSLTNGVDGSVLAPNESAFETALLPVSADSGIYFLDRIDLFNLLCVPGEADPATLSSLEGFCRERRAFLIADSDKDDSFTDLENGPDGSLTGDDGINAALYFPWIKAPNPLKENHPEAFPPSGFVAGLYARTDTNRGVWKAPAGTEASLRGVTGVQETLTNDENGVLNPLAVNCIRNFPIYGTIIWGGRTLRGNDEIGSEWKYIPVRRTALFIEETLYRALKWVVFEPNDEPLWAQIRLNVGAFMHGLFRQSAFQGTTPREAYFVKCDKETTTQNDINKGIVNIIVGFAPLKPAEFVIIKIQQIAGQIEV
jgi:phage tail sheath protein FI